MEISLSREQHRSPGTETRKRYRGLVTWAESEPGQKASPSGFTITESVFVWPRQLPGKKRKDWGVTGSWSRDLGGSRRETVLFAHRGSKQRGDIYFIEQMRKQAHRRKVWTQFLHGHQAAQIPSSSLVLKS